METLVEIAEKHVLTRRPTWRFPSEGLELSLEELYRLSLQYAQKLAVLGIGHQDRVGLILDNSSDYVALIIALLKLNATIVPLRPKWNKHTKSDTYLTKCDDVCDFKLMLYEDAAIASVFERWTDKTRKLALSLDAFKLKPAHPESYPRPQTHSHDIAVLQFSSGSTGQPKAVIVTHAMMMAQLVNLVENHTRSRRGTPVASSASWMPIHHDMGLFIGVLKPLFVGCDNLLAPPSYYMRNPGRWFSHLSAHRVDFTFTTNSALATTLNMVARKLQGTDISLDALHIYIAAEKVSPLMVRRCYETLPQLRMPIDQLHVGYGMAENALGCSCTRTPTISIIRCLIDDHGHVVPMASNDSRSAAIELVSIGTSDNLHEITVRDESDRVLPELHLGEINIVGPCVSPGYLNNDEATRRAFVNGRFRSGDLGFFFAGELYFYGRRDDMITVGGRNIVPDDIEALAEELPFIRPTTTCLIAVENNSTGTMELVFLVEMSPLTKTETLKDHAMTVQHHIYSELMVLLTRVLFCPKGTIEKTSSGKKRRKVIRTRLMNNQLETIGM
jgi:acyl-CoA synthetase (AMP-forming)/AMP-acid ligase II